MIQPHLICAAGVAGFAFAEELPRHGFRQLPPTGRDGARILWLSARTRTPWTPQWSLNTARPQYPHGHRSSRRQLLPERAAPLVGQRAHGPRDTKTYVVVLVRRIVVVAVRGAQVVLGVVPVATADRAILGRFLLRGTLWKTIGKEPPGASPNSGRVLCVRSMLSPIA
jgi:hypothetical protein